MRHSAKNGINGITSITSINSINSITSDAINLSTREHFRTLPCLVKLPALIIGYQLRFLDAQRCMPRCSKLDVELDVKLDVKPNVDITSECTTETHTHILQRKIDRPSGRVSLIVVHIIRFSNGRGSRMCVPGFLRSFRKTHERAKRSFIQ